LKSINVNILFAEYSELPALQTQAQESDNVIHIQKEKEKVDKKARKKNTST